MTKYLAVLLFALTHLVACGGSGGSSSGATVNSQISVPDNTSFIDPLESIAGKRIVIDIDWGILPWASSGSALVEFDTQTYIVRGDQAGVINSAGTYSYTDGIASVSDSAIGDADYIFMFTDPNSGVYEAKTADGVTRQLGAFRIL